MSWCACSGNRKQTKIIRDSRGKAKAFGIRILDSYTEREREGCCGEKWFKR